MNGPDQPVTLTDIDRRLRAQRRQRDESLARRFHKRIVLPGTMLQLASRASNDVIAAFLISIAFGAGLDGLFNTSPWGIVVMFTFGVVAAIRNVYQTATRAAEAEDEAPGTPGHKIMTRGHT
ncbi:MAG: AtpZ/AtpI family protein [Rhodospirillaceae bacterium]